MTATIPVKKKIPMQWAAAAFEQISNEIVEAQDIDAALASQFKDSEIDLAESVDRRMAFWRHAQNFFKTCKLGKSEINKAQKDHEKMLAVFVEKTIELIEKHPDIPFKDSYGKKLSVVQNGTPVLKTELDLKIKSVSNVVALEECELFGVDPKYLKKVSYMTLDVDAVNADLRAKVELAWAELKWGKYLKGLPNDNKKRADDLPENLGDNG